MIQSLVTLDDESNQTRTHRTDKTKEKRYAALENAKKEKDTIKVAKETSRTRLSVSFEIVSSGSEKGYEVEISDTPTCTCKDCKKFNGKERCNHVIWVYVYILKVDENSQLIHLIAN